MNSQDTLPPNEPTAEKAMIGCALQDPSLAPELRPEWFYDLRWRTIAEIILSLAAEGKRIGAETVSQAAGAKGLENATALVLECDGACHSPANFPYWRDQLSECLMLRRILQVSLGAVDAVGRREGTPQEILEAFEREALAIRQHSDAGGLGEADIREALLELGADYDRAARDGSPAGIQTGYHDVDRLLGGLKPQQLFVVAARPSVGKTALAVNIAERVALDTKTPVGLFSLEMSTKELLHRLACSRARVDGTRLTSGLASDPEKSLVLSTHAEILRAPLYICDRGGLTLAQLTAQARRMVQRHGIKLLIVDYLGLLRSGEKGRSRYEETTLVSNGLKCLAKELNLPLLALAQLNRDTDRDGRAPRLSDLRDSGSIEQDADIVALLHRESEDDAAETDRILLIIAKNRNGRTGGVPLTFLRAFTRFELASRFEEAT